MKELEIIASVYDKMQMQKQNHEINPVDYPEPTFEMVKDWAVEEVEKKASKLKTASVPILNTPKTTKKYIVARSDKGVLWFYGSYEDYDRAMDVAIEVDGVVAYAE